GVAAVLVGVLPPPGDGALAVDEVLGEADLRRQPVVGVDGDPAVRAEVPDRRQALLPLVADDPPAAVDLEDPGPLVPWLRVTRLGDVEPEAHLLALAGRRLGEG